MTVYLIHPLGEALGKRRKSTSSGAEKEKPHEKSLTDEEEAQKILYMIEKDKDFLKLLMKAVPTKIDRDSPIILLHPTEPLYPNWGIYSIAFKYICSSWKQTIPFEAAGYSGWWPRRAWQEMDRKPTAFYSYQLKEDSE